MINKFRYRKPPQAQSNGASDTVPRKNETKVESKSFTMNLAGSKEDTVFSSVLDAETKKKLKVKDAVVDLNLLIEYKGTIYCSQSNFAVLII